MNQRPFMLSSVSRRPSVVGKLLLCVLVGYYILHTPFAAARSVESRTSHTPTFDAQECIIGWVVCKSSRTLTIFDTASIAKTAQTQGAALDQAYFLKYTFMDR